MFIKLRTYIVIHSMLTIASLSWICVANGGHFSHFFSFISLKCIWYDVIIMKRPKMGLVTKFVSSMTTSSFAYCKMTPENTKNDTFLCTSEKYISHSSIGVKFWYVILMILMRRFAVKNLLLQLFWGILIKWLDYMVLKSVTWAVDLRDPHYVRMCFKSVKTLGVFHS